MLQTRTVEPRTLELLKQLMKEDYIASFYLVGGTALALQIGHRISIDLDFFTTESFSPPNLLNQLSDKYDVTVVSETSSMLISTIAQIKVDFVKMAYPILFPTLEIEGVRMLSIQDIAPMKMKAIVQRGSKKDFYDIYYLLKMDLISLPEIIELFQKKFQQQEVFHVIKSLTYFEDAEEYADPILFDKSISWEDVKTYIKEAVKNTL